MDTLPPSGARGEPPEQLKRYLCVCLEPCTRKTDEIVILPFKTFLEALWNGEYR